jgi:hypothetical protein
LGDFSILFLGRWILPFLGRCFFAVPLANLRSFSRRSIIVLDLVPEISPDREDSSLGHWSRSERSSLCLPDYKYPFFLGMLPLNFSYSYRSRRRFFSPRILSVIWAHLSHLKSLNLWLSLPTAPLPSPCEEGI